MTGKTIEISVVIPVYNSAQSLHELYYRLRGVLGDKLKKTYELVFVDDFSADNSWATLEELRQLDCRVKTIRLMRNFGQHNAIVCGLNNCSGQYVVTIDDDLQHPPEEIPRMLAEIEKGYDVVYGVYDEKKHSILQNLGSACIHFLHNRILGNPRQLRSTSFRLLRRNVVEYIVARAQSEFCYITAHIMKYVTPDKIGNIMIAHQPRKSGRSNYTILKMFSLASNLLINYSAIPLRFTIYAGFALSGGCVLYAIYILLRVIFGGPVQIAGWASLAFLTTFLFGMLFLFLGIIGEYIFRILREVSGNEPYIIKEIRGFNPGSPNRTDTTC
jgi:glycosyltransferase involved in cell wall biosynthesis